MENMYLIAPIILLVFGVITILIFEIIGMRTKEEDKYEKIIDIRKKNIELEIQKSGGIKEKLERFDNELNEGYKEGNIRMVCLLLAKRILELEEKLDNRIGAGSGG